MFKNVKTQSGHFKNVMTLMTGTSISQLIPVLVSPILTRIYTPEDFGLFATYVSIVALISVVSTGKYDAAIILPSKDSRALNLAIISLFLTLSISLLTLIIFFLFKVEIINLLEINHFGNWLYLVPASVFLVSLHKILYMWNNRNKKYKDMSLSYVAQSSSNALFNVGFGVFGLQAVGLIITNLLGYVVAIYVLIRKTVSVQYIKSVCSIKVMLMLADKYKEFPKYTLPQNFVYQGTLQLPIIFIGIVFSSATLGYFSLAYRILGAPLSIISTSLGSVVYQKASDMYESDRIKLHGYVRKLIFILLALAALVGVPIILVLPTLFGWVFGSNWIRAGEIGQILSIYMILSFALTPFSGIYLIAKKNLFYLKWEIARFAALVLFMVAFVVFEANNELQFFVFYSVINLLLYIVISIPLIRKKSFLWV